MKVRGVYVVRAQGRRVNSGVNRVCAHGGRASRHQAMRSARSGWAREGRPACSVSRVAVPEKRGGANARSVRGPGCQAQEEGLRASVRVQGACACLALGVGRGAYSPRVPPWGRGSDSRLCLSSAAPVPASRRWLAQEPDCQPLRHPCSVTGTRLAPEPCCTDGGSAGPGGQMEQRRSPGTLPGARRALPRARPPARPPAPS